jgi:hypothetical protein
MATLPIPTKLGHFELLRLHEVSVFPHFVGRSVQKIIYTSCGEKKGKRKGEKKRARFDFEEISQSVCGNV